MSVPPIGADPRTQLLKIKAREEGFTDLEVMGLQKLARSAWMVGATTQDIERNLSRIKPACRRMLGNPTVSSEALAREGSCNSLLQRGDLPGAQRLLGGVFAKRIVNPQQRLRKLQQSVHQSADKAALERERQRNLDIARANQLKSLGLGIYDDITHGNLGQAADKLKGEFSNLASQALVKFSNSDSDTLASVVSETAKYAAVFYGLMATRRTEAAADGAAAAALQAAPAWLSSTTLFALLKRASYLGVYLTAEGLAQSQLGVSPTAEILRGILAGVQMLGAGVTSVLSQMLQQVIQGKPPSPPPPEEKKDVGETPPPDEPPAPTPPPTQPPFGQFVATVARGESMRRPGYLPN